METALIIGETYDVGHGLGVHVPTIRQIIEYGQDEYYHIVSLLTAISSDCKAALWDVGLDWVDVSDMQMFVLATRELTAQQSAVIFEPAIDFTQLRIQGTDSGDLRLCDVDGNIVIDDESRKHIAGFFCKLHNIAKKPERPYNQFAHDQLIAESRIQAARAKADNARNALWPLISFVANAPGSKYNYESCLDMRISTFMDCVSRLQIISDASALRGACYSGMIDGTKLKHDEALNALREIAPPKPRQVVNFK